MPDSRHPHKYEELFPQEFWEEFERDATLDLGRRYVDHISRNLANKAQELLEQARSKVDQ